MSGSPTPEPTLFTKRRRKASSVQKRRRTTTDTTSSSPQTQQHINDSSNARGSSARTKSRFQAKLKQAPLVPGYEQSAEDSQPNHTSYSQETLRQLKDQLRIKPFSQQTNPQQDQPKAAATHSEQRSKETLTTKKIVVDTAETTKSNPRDQHTPTLPQPLRKREERYIPGTAKAQPFSVAWNARVYDDDDIEIEPVSNIPIKGDEASGSETGEEEWEAQLMRRGGQKHEGDEEAMVRRQIRLIREVEEEGLQSGMYNKLKLDIEKQVDSLAGRQAFVEQKIARLEQVIKENDRIEGTVKEKVEDVQRKVDLYERLVACVSNASRKAADCAQDIARLGSTVDADMKQRIKENMIGLTGGTDQFGREREGHLRGIGELREDFVEWGGRLVRDIGDEAHEFQQKLQLNQLLKVMSDWHERYPDEYTSSSAEPALGKLFGNVALIQNDINWICDLAEREQMIPNVVLGFGIQRFATWMRARWEPRLQESCEYVGRVVNCVVGAVPGAAEVIREALEDRFMLEIRACETLKSDGVRLALRGAILLAKQTQMDPGLLQALCLCETICGLEDSTEDVEWITSFPYLRGDTEQVRSRFFSRSEPTCEKRDGKV